MAQQQQQNDATAIDLSGGIQREPSLALPLNAEITFPAIPSFLPVRCKSPKPRTISIFNSPVSRLAQLR
jgi:hypothetical protein